MYLIVGLGGGGRYSGGEGGTGLIQEVLCGLFLVFRDLVVSSSEERPNKERPWN